MITKYKAWDKLNKEMIEDVASIHFKTEMIVTSNLCFYPFKDIELLQSTGLFDKNGTEIYEGDIIHYKIEDKSNDGSPYTLRELTGYIYKEGNCMWVKVNDSEIVPLWCLEDQYVIFKILGNIYEHPHLLGEE